MTTALASSAIMPNGVLMIPFFAGFLTDTSISPDTSLTMLFCGRVNLESGRHLTNRPSGSSSRGVARGKLMSSILRIPWRAALAAGPMR